MEALITFGISVIALIVFFVMSANIATLTTLSRRQTALLEDIKSQIAPTWQELVERAELQKFKGNIQASIDNYKDAVFQLEKLCSGGKNKNLLDRLDGLKLIIKKLESGD